MIFFLMLLSIWSFQAEAPTDALPIGQIRLTAFVWLRDAPDGEQVARGRPGDVLPYYAQEGAWLRAEAGWVPRAAGTLEAARVEYGAWPFSAWGVAALQDEYALLYSPTRVGWVPLRGLALTAPSEALRVFGERPAVVRRLSAPLFLIPAPALSLAELPLGQTAEVLHSRADGWGLVRAADYVGWMRLDDLDVQAAPVAAGTLNAGPVNVRRAPVDGTVITGVGFREQVYLLGINPAGDWLYIRTDDGDEGWIAARFVDDLPDDLPRLNPGEG